MKLELYSLLQISQFTLEIKLSGILQYQYKGTYDISLLSVYERNIFITQMLQIMNELACDGRICIFYIIDAT